MTNTTKRLADGSASLPTTDHSVHLDFMAEVRPPGKDRDAAIWAVAEIARLQEAKRAALKVADERSKENVGLRHTLAGIVEYCEQDGVSAVERLRAIRNTAEQAMR